jgi:hypothetical protein
MNISKRWWLLLLLPLGAALLWWWPDAGEEAEQVTFDADAGRVDVPDFRLVTARDNFGVDFVPENGAYGEKLLPETMGQGVAMVDLDRDGDLDLIFVNGTAWPWHEKNAGSTRLLHVYANDGTGHFRPIQIPGLGEQKGYGQAIVAAELNGDGKPDVFVTAVGRNFLYLSSDHGYELRDSVVNGPEDEWSTGALLFDADTDGDLDLLVASYVTWSPELDRRINYQLAGIGKAYGPPRDYPGGRLHLYENLGYGQFVDATSKSGLQALWSEGRESAIKALALQALDADADGDLDVFVANDTTANMLLENQGDGTFRERGASLGVAYDNQGHSTGAMGADTFSLSNGEQWLVVGNFANEANSLYWRAPGSDFYSDMAAATGMAALTRRALTFGVLFVDLNLDGMPETFQVNGHVENEIARLSAQQTYAQPPLLMWRCSDCGGRWLDTGVMSDQRWVGRGLAAGDLNGDGRPDLVLTQVARSPVVLMNETEAAQEALVVRLTGRGENSDAIGAVVELEVAGAPVQRQWVLPVRGYFSQSDMRLYFARPKGAAATVRIRWPDGRQSAASIPANTPSASVSQPGSEP